MASILVRYEVRVTTGNPALCGMFGDTEIIACARRQEAIDLAARLSAENPDAHVDAIQIGSAGGDAATATGLIWSMDARR